MSKRNRRRTRRQKIESASQNSPTRKGGSSFSFGDPEAVLGSQLTDYLGTFLQDEQGYYVPPISPTGLVKLLGANPHHGSCIYFKRNQLVAAYQPNPLLPVLAFNAAALDFQTLGRLYLQVFRNGLGKVTRLGHLPGVYMRKGKDGRFCMLQGDGQPVWFKAGEVIAVDEYDPLQQIYGTPQYMGAIQSALLGEDATLFRRRYYKNGSHMGFIFYTNDPEMDPVVEKKLKEQIKAGKGVGNFKSMFINIPGGSEKAVQIIPIGDISQKDEFERIKRISADEVLVGHRMQAALGGAKPDNTGGFGDIEKIDRVYQKNEIVPQGLLISEGINQYLAAGQWIRFNFPCLDK